MADSSSRDKQEMFLQNAGQLPMSSIIPAIEEARKQRPPFVPSVGLPNVIRTPQERMVERVMENCAFKSVLAGVVGMKMSCFRIMHFSNIRSEFTVQGHFYNLFLLSFGKR